mgnify:CR=1 FL=1
MYEATGSDGIDDLVRSLCLWPEAEHTLTHTAQHTPKYHNFIHFVSQLSMVVVNGGVIIGLVALLATTNKVF